MSSIEDKLLYLKQTKSLIRDAIEEKGQSITDQDTFRSYVDKIKNIESGSGDVKLFKSLDELTSSTDNKEGDIALIYDDTPTPLQLDKDKIGPFDKSVSIIANLKEITFSNTITLGSESIIYDSNKYGSMGPYQIYIQRGNNYLYIWLSPMQSSLFCSYTSTDGKIYTLDSDNLPDPENIPLNSTYTSLMNDVQDINTYNRILSIFNPQLIALKQFKNNEWIDLPSQLDSGEQYLLDGKTYLGKTGVVTGLGGIYNELSPEKLYKAYINSDNTKTGYECQVLSINNTKVDTDINGFIHRYKLDPNGDKFIRVFRLGGDNTSIEYASWYTSFIDDNYLYLNNTSYNGDTGGIVKINLSTWELSVLGNDDLKNDMYSMTFDRNLKNIYLFSHYNSKIYCINYETEDIYSKSISNLTVLNSGCIMPSSKNYIYYYTRTGTYSSGYTSKIFRLSKKFYEDNSEPEQVDETTNWDSLYPLDGCDYVSGFQHDRTDVLLWTQEDDVLHKIELFDVNNSNLNVFKYINILYPFDNEHLLMYGNLINKDTFEVSQYTGTDKDVYSLLKNEFGFIGNNYNNMNMNVNHITNEGTILLDDSNNPINLTILGPYTQYPKAFYCYNNKFIEVPGTKWVTELFRVSECNNTEPADFIITHNQSVMEVNTNHTLVYLLNEPPTTEGVLTYEEYMKALQTSKEILGTE